MSFIMLYPKLWPFFIDRKRWSMDLPSFPIFWDKLQVLHFLPIIFNMMRSCVYCLWLLLSPFEMMYWCYCRKRIRQVCDFGPAFFMKHRFWGKGTNILHDTTWTIWDVAPRGNGVIWPWLGGKWPWLGAQKSRWSIPLYPDLYPHDIYAKSLLSWSTP